MDPSSVAQEHDVWPARAILAGMEVAAEHGMDTEGLEEAAAHALGLHWLRTGGSAQEIAGPAVNIERAEGFVQPLPVQIVRIRERPAWRFHVAFVHRHQPDWICIRKRFQQSRIHKTEDGHAHADAERQHKDRGGCETGAAAELAQAVM